MTGCPDPPAAPARTPLAAALAMFVLSSCGAPVPAPEPPRESRAGAAGPARVDFKPRQALDTSGYTTVIESLRPWEPTATLQEVRDVWHRAGYRAIEAIDRKLAAGGGRGDIPALLQKAMLFQYEGEPARAYKTLEQARALAESRPELKAPWLYTVIFFQGVSALRRGENENCIDCRGESSCILPIAPEAVHTNPQGSRLAIKHFTEYLDRFPDDLEVRWLLNLAHMTLGEHPGKVDPRYLISLDRFRSPVEGAVRFRDVGHLVGVNRLNQSGGAVMDDFDNDGRLDLVVTTGDPTERMAFYRNAGDGTFEDRTESAGLAGQLGGLNCVQTDFDNDGNLDVYIPRGAWLPYPVRPSLLRNIGDGTFSDVTKAAGLLDPVNSVAASWADFDNDGHLDLFVCGETSPSRLYHNRGDGTFEEVAARAGVRTGGRSLDPVAKGCAWLDFDNDDDPDLFVNDLKGTGQLFRNNGDGTFTDVTGALGINGPEHGFSCWAWDYDNDGWLDLFATSFDHTVADVVAGLIGREHHSKPNKLYHNRQGRGFEDRTREAGLDLVFAAMGSNFGDFDNDGFLDFYLGTGDPTLTALVPNRMFRNVGGTHFAEVTGPSGTGHLQKGHGVAWGDWDRDGDLDLFIEMGGAINGDKYHNVLFQNPGRGNHWLTVKLVGRKTNRAAIGARIKVVTAGEKALTVHRVVSSGSSFGGNPLEQTIGLAGATRVARLEIHWPTSGTTQVLEDLPADRAVEVTEFSDTYRTLDGAPIPLPQ